MELTYKKIIYLFLVFIFLPGVANAGEYQYEMHVKNTNVYKYPFERNDIEISLTNRGTASWDSTSKTSPIFLSYHLYDKDKKIIKFDNIRTNFISIIEPGQSINVKLKVEHLPVGIFILRIDLVAENITWFEYSKNLPVDVVLHIKDPHKLKNDIQHYNNNRKINAGISWHLSGNNFVNFCQLITNYTIKNNFNEFEFFKHNVSGFTAGSGYPQIWIRDSYSIMPVAKYIYDDKNLTSWIKAHLRIQKENGELYDWISSNDKYDKNTSETDQETSLIIAAYEISSVIGFDWLADELKGKSIIDRLNDALQFVFENKIDDTTGLILSGHTADWGDVTDEFPDQRSICLYDDSNKVVGIYTNSLVYGAAKSLSVMLEKLNSKKKAIYWLSKANSIRTQIQNHLWSSSNGYYIVHKHHNYPDHDDFDEKNIFAMGGNAIAIEMGVATTAQAEKIINQAVLRQELFNFSTISGVMLPPYPKNFFKHPALDEYYEYQNGGQWDWFGGRLVLQMFRYKDSNAFSKLDEICKKIFRNQGVYEWESMDGKPYGSAYYTGSAASIERAITEGLFGIDLSFEDINIIPRLGTKKGSIYIPIVANKSFLTYSYNPTTINDNTICLEFQLSSNIIGKKKIFLPKDIGDYHYTKFDNLSNLIINLKEAKSIYSNESMLLLVANNKNLKFKIIYTKQ